MTASGRPARRPHGKQKTCAWSSWVGCRA